MGWARMARLLCATLLDQPDLLEEATVAVVFGDEQNSVNMHDLVGETIRIIENINDTRLHF